MTDQPEEVQELEIDALKNRADTLGITYHPNIGVDKLRDKVAAALEPKAAPTKAAVKETEGEKKYRIKRVATELIRVRVTCMNPNKREWTGEIFSVGNKYTGTIKKMVPFGVEWHVPRIILNMIQDRKCQIFVTQRDGKGLKGKLIKEFSVEVLPNLTSKEMKDLAQRQAMAAGE